jgi:PPOX class probable FMN-dependent enzyme
VTDLCAEDLATIYAQPSPRVIAKARPAIDAHAKKFIEMSPFCVLATSGADGSVDASPRGGGVGFVHIAGPNQLLMPDRSGNNRIDSFRNVVEGSGFVHLLFFVPGIDETLRVYGTTTLTRPDTLDVDLTDLGKPPLSVLVLQVERAYFQCAKAVMRSGLWDPSRRVDRSVFPPFSQVLRDHCRDATVPQDEEAMRAGLALEL